VDGSESLARLWKAGVRGYQLVFNVPGDPVRRGGRGLPPRPRRARRRQAADVAAVRAGRRPEFTRGHFARAV
jgi:putative protease